MIPLCYDHHRKPAVMFTLRSQKVGTHKVSKPNRLLNNNNQGQVSFPGGMLDSTDKDIIHCALR